MRDETPTGKTVGEDQHLDLPDVVTLRELIGHRVREEVARYNLDRGDTFTGLIRPTDAEVARNGYRMRAPRKVAWERQADIAIDGFERNAFFVLVRDRQVDDLDEPLHLSDADDVAFVRLVPLAGG